MISLERVERIATRFAGKRIAVFGDLMLDVYEWGAASRISQEAPVPIVRIQRGSDCLGGAANVMRNVVTLGGRVDAYGVIGDDLNGERLKTRLDEYEINADGVVADPERRTIEKRRIIAGNQQLLRIDYEDPAPVSASIKHRLVDLVLGKIERSEMEAIIFEDYAKGLLDQDMVETVRAAAAAKGIIVALDPNPAHKLLVEGLTLITPNRQEAFGMAEVYCSDSAGDGVEERLGEVARRLGERWKPEHLLITLGSRGMALYDRGGDSVIIPTRAREVFDVSGAGDTVIAAFTLALLGDASGEEAAEIANHAAGVVVGKIGTVSVELSELMGSFAEAE